MYEPVYVIHDNEKWDMSSGDRKLLMKVLNSTTEDGRKVWDQIKDAAVDYATQYNSKATAEDIERIKSAKMPNYKDLHYKDNTKS